MADWDLSGLGIQQADNISKNLLNELKDKNYIMYSSYLLRAKYITEIFGKHL